MKKPGELNEELAELLGWRMFGTGWLLPDMETFVSDFHEDLNDMQQVWKVIHQRSKWMEFCEVWTKDYCSENENYGWSCGEWTYRFLLDLPGQVRAAIEVL